MANTERQAQLEQTRRIWQARIENWQQSELNQAEYCRQHDLKYHRFVYWRKKYLPRSAGSSRTDLVELPATLTTGFFGDRRCPIRLAVAGGYRIEVERDFDPVALRQLIAVVEQL